MRTGRNLTLALAMLATGTVVGVSAQHLVGADGRGSDELLAFVPIEPCRLADTRPGTNNVGPRSTKLGPEVVQTFDAFDSSTPCAGVIPTDATSISTNITALGATELSFLTIWAGGQRPLAASLNPAPGEPPTPNAVTTALSPTGTFNVFNASGSTDVVIDVNGYHVGHDARVDAEFTIPASDAWVQPGGANAPFFSLIPPPGGAPGVQLFEEEASAFGVTWNIGAGVDLADGLSISTSYVPNEENLLLNPDGCSFAMSTSPLLVTRAGSHPFEVETTMGPIDEPYTYEAGIEWAPVDGLTIQADYGITVPDLDDLQEGDTVSIVMYRDPVHIDDTCTDSMSVVQFGVAFDF